MTTSSTTEQSQEEFSATTTTTTTTTTIKAAALASAQQHSFSLRKPTPQEQRKVKEVRQNGAPAKYDVNARHLDEFTSQHDLFLRRKAHATAGTHSSPAAAAIASSDSFKLDSPAVSASTKPAVAAKSQALKEPLSIKPMMLVNFLSDGIHLYLSHVFHPSRIPGNDIFSRVYAMGILPVLIVVLTIVQGGIGLLVILVNHTRIGAYFYDRFFNDQIALFDDKGKAKYFVFVFVLGDEKVMRAKKKAHRVVIGA
jgi:hypothetical protein